MADKDKAEESPTVDGVIGQLEIYESGTVKMRMRNGIVMDVSVVFGKLVVSVIYVLLYHCLCTGHCRYTTVLSTARYLP